jgi:hypothetical protein
MKVWDWAPFLVQERTTCEHKAYFSPVWHQGSRDYINVFREVFDASANELDL